MKINKSEKWFVLAGGSITMTLALLFSFIDLAEFYNVAIAKNVAEYPWGPINTNPWYYSDSSTYWKYCLASGITFLAAGIFTLISVIKLHIKQTIISTGIIILIFILTLISGAYTM